MAWWERFAKAEGTPGDSSEERVDLYDLELDEVSFVDRGDNAGAHILLYKRREGAPVEPVGAFKRGEHAEPEMVQAIVDEVLAGEVQAGTAIRKEPMTTQFTKADDVVAAVHKAAEDLVGQNDQLTIAEARVEVWLQNPGLRERYQQMRIEEAQAVGDTMKRQPGGMMAVAPESVQKAQATVLQKHQAAVSELRKADPRLSLAEARRMAWERDPALYEEYRRAG